MAARTRAGLRELRPLDVRSAPDHGAGPGPPQRLQKARRSGWTTVATLTAVALNQPVGNAVGEARPYATHPGLLRLASATSDFSFPSDHAVMAGAVAAGLLLVSRRLGLIAVVLAVVMAFARVYIGAHYPWDVAAGLGLGASVAGFGWLVLRRPLVALTAWLRALPLLRSLFAARTTAGVQTLTPGRARP